MQRFSSISRAREDRLHRQQAGEPIERDPIADFRVKLRFNIVEQDELQDGLAYLHLVAILQRHPVDPPPVDEGMVRALQVDQVEFDALGFGVEREFNARMFPGGEIVGDADICLDAATDQHGAATQPEVTSDLGALQHNQGGVGFGQVLRFERRTIAGFRLIERGLRHRFQIPPPGLATPHDYIPEFVAAQARAPRQALRCQSNAAASIVQSRLWGGGPSSIARNRRLSAEQCRSDGLCGDVAGQEPVSRLDLRQLAPSLRVAFERYQSGRVRPQGRLQPQVGGQDLLGRCSGSEVEYGVRVR